MIADKNAHRTMLLGEAKSCLDNTIEKTGLAREELIATLRLLQGIPALSGLLLDANRGLNTAYEKALLARSIFVRQFPEIS